jgi:hypothetical protein
LDSFGGWSLYHAFILTQDSELYNKKLQQAAELDPKSSCYYLLMFLQEFLSVSAAGLENCDLARLWLRHPRFRPTAGFILLWLGKLCFLLWRSTGFSPITSYMN